MYYKYGTYQHSAGEVALDVKQQIVHNRRGYRELIRYQHVLTGTLIASTQATIKTAINGLQNAYAVDFKDAGLYHDDGTASAHVLLNGSSVGGVRVVEVDWPNEEATYATGATFRVVLEADYLASGVVNLSHFEESVRINGDGGPRKVMVEVMNGPPIQQVVSQRTAQRATQSGRAVGLNSYPIPPAPLWPQYFQPDASDVTRRSGERIGGTRKFFEVSWNYSFWGVGLSGFPHQG